MNAETAVSQQARIVGRVEYREGDGPNIVIRPGPCAVQATALDVTISWSDGDSRGSAAMPLTDFKRFVAKGLITLAESSGLSVPPIPSPKTPTPP